MQLLKVSFYNPITQMVLTLTNFAVRPARRFIPSWKKIDLSTLVLAFITQLILQVALLWIKGFPFEVANVPIWPSLIGLSLLGLVRTAMDIFFYAILIQVVLSWVNPHSPISPILAELTKPVLRPIQKLVSPINGIDFSPMIALILLQMVNISVVRTLESSILAIF